MSTKAQTQHLLLEGRRREVVVEKEKAGRGSINMLRCQGAESLRTVSRGVSPDEVKMKEVKKRVKVKAVLKLTKCLRYGEDDIQRH
jgi:hypothetical protein